MKILKFFTETCQACKTVDRLLVSLKKNFDVNINHININNKSKKIENLVKEHDVKSVPTLVFQKNDEVVEKVVGKTSERELKNIMEKYNG